MCIGYVVPVSMLKEAKLPLFLFWNVIFAKDIQVNGLECIIFDGNSLLVVLDCCCFRYDQSGAQESRYRKDTCVDYGICVHTLPGIVALLLFRSQHTQEEGGGKTPHVADKATRSIRLHQSCKEGDTG